MDPDQLRSGLTARFPAVGRFSPDVCAVGGAIRDLLMGRLPADLDLVCRSASDEAHKLAASIGSRVVPLGRGAIAVYRVPAGDVEYDFAELTGDSVERDLQRRDFTLNAMALPLGRPGGLIDPYRGVEDIAAGVLRMVSATNIVDDPLRVIRAVRLASLFELTIDPATLNILRDTTPAVASVAPERVTSELDAILGGERRGRSMALLRSTGVDHVVFGRLLSDQTIEALDRLAGDVPASYALIFLGGTDSQIGVHAARWRWSDATLKGVASTVRLVRGAREGLHLPILLHHAGPAAAERALAVLRAIGEEGEYSAMAAVMDQRGKEIFEMRPLLDGEAIAALTGIPPGPRLGELRRRLLEAQLRQEVEDSEEAVSFVRRSVGQLDVDVSDADGYIEER
jgi:hypothetical protein